MNQQFDSVVSARDVEGRPQHLRALTGLRFVLASMIALLHYGSLFGPNSPHHYIALGQAVSMFFILSGFVLSHAYPRFPNRRAVSNFLVARVARIWPVHLFSLALLFLLLGDPTILGVGPATAYSATLNVFLLQTWDAHFATAFGFNSVSWTLSTEVGFYLAFPFLIQNFEKTWRQKLTVALAVSLLAVALCTLLDLTKTGAAGGLSAAAIAGANPIPRLFEFILGMVAYKLWKHGRWFASDGRTATRMELVSLFLVVLGLFASPQLALILESYLGEPAHDWAMRTGLTVFAFPALLIVLASGRGSVSRLFATPWFVILGHASFAFYMLHQPILRAYVHYVGVDQTDPVGLLMRIAILALTTVAFSIAVFRIVEEPSRRGVVGWSKRRNAPTTQN